MTPPLPPPPAASPDWAWFLDVDGTLIEIADTPSAIHMPGWVPPMLERLAARHGGALALVSGRTVDNILRLVEPRRFPAAGLHGMERTLPGGGLARPDPLPELDVLRHRLGCFAQARPGVLLEDKGLSLVLHYRLAPELQEECRREAEAVLAEWPRLRVLAGKMVFEIKPKGYDKGAALKAFMAEPPFAGRRPVFVGDDVTDEYGFRAAAGLDGFGVLVGEGRETAAAYGLADVPACLEWLKGAAGRSSVR